MWWRCALQAMVAYAALHGGEGGTIRGQETGTAADDARAAESDTAIGRITEQIQASPGDWRLHYVRGQLYRQRRQFDRAAADFSAAIKLAPRESLLYEERGSAAFCAGKIKESIADFDRQIELNPQAEKGHWKRGISYYYAGEFAKGQKQFEAYQTYDDSDVENAVWRFLCMVPQVGLKNAQQQILKVGRDNRVPMREIYELYAGRLQPDDVLAAVTSDKPAEVVLHQRLFYAHLYLGLYHEVTGDKKLAQQHMEQADRRQIGHYMWDVAHVHLARMKAGDSQPESK